MLITFSVLTLLSIATWMDFRTDKISNRLILFGIILGTSYQICIHGVPGVGISLIRFFYPVILLFLLFSLRALGAGDIKLFSVVSIFTEPHIFIRVVIVSFIFGAIIGVVKLVKKKMIFASFLKMKMYAEDCVINKKVSAYDVGGNFNNRIHFSLAILLGYLVVQEVCLCLN